MLSYYVLPLQLRVKRKRKWNMTWKLGEDRDLRFRAQGPVLNGPQCSQAGKVIHKAVVHDVPVMVESGVETARPYVQQAHAQNHRFGV